MGNKNKFLFSVLLTISLSFCNLFQNICNSLDPSLLLELLNKVKNGQNIIFTKFGDGEYNCMTSPYGQNCDKDKYHTWLGESLKKALISLSKKPNTYIGRWPTPQVYEYCNQIVRQAGSNIPWVSYHLVMNDDEFFKYDYMYKFVQFIVSSKRKKILICNSMNKRLKDFFKADIYIEIPSTSWSFQYNHYKNLVEQHAKKDSIILICGGLCSKVLIDDITNKFDLTFIDLGSSFDLLARRQKSRPWNHSYEDELRYYKDFLPENWDKRFYYRILDYSLGLKNNFTEQVNKSYMTAKNILAKKGKFNV